MLAVKLHRNPKPWLGKESFLIPIVDWKSGRHHVRTWLRWEHRDRYLTLVRIPDDHPVSIRFTYGASNFIKAVAWPTEFKPLREWPQDYVKAISLWWDAYRPHSSGEVEIGGLVVEEPRLFLGRKLPDASILWTKDYRLLYWKKTAKKSARCSHAS
jgi:hypothetical protein